MNVADFKDTLTSLRNTNSRNEKQEIIAEVQDNPAAISFLSGSEYDDAGLGKKTVLSVAQDVFGDDVDGKPTVSESLEQFDDMDANSGNLSSLRRDMESLREKSGNNMKGHLEAMFLHSSVPSVVAFACLDDLPTGVGNSTIAEAMDVKDSLPFYDGVHEIAKADEPLTSPEVGSAFSPMLAVPESRGRPDNPVAQRKVDGYRAIVHISGRDQEVQVFSRRMNEVTESLPELQEVNWPAGEYILDGEIIAETGSYSDTSERIGRKAENVDRDVEMNFALFDCIVYRGMDISDGAYNQRYKQAQNVSDYTDERVFLLDVHDDIELALDDAIDNGEEGIIVKDWQAPYEFDKRSSAWQKVKVDDCTVDLVISGFEEGEGKASGTLGKVELETADGVYVGNSGSGFTDEQRDTIWNNRSEWMDRTIEVEARGLGTGDKLRMPIFVRDRSDDGEPDSWERVQELMQNV